MNYLLKNKQKKQPVAKMAWMLGVVLGTEALFFSPQPLWAQQKEICQVCSSHDPISEEAQALSGINEASDEDAKAAQLHLDVWMGKWEQIIPMLVRAELIDWSKTADWYFYAAERQAVRKFKTQLLSLVTDPRGWEVEANILNKTLKRVKIDRYLEKLFGLSPLAKEKLTYDFGNSVLGEQLQGVTLEGFPESSPLHQANLGRFFRKTSARQNQIVPAVFALNRWMVQQGEFLKAQSIALEKLKQLEALRLELVLKREQIQDAKRVEEQGAQEELHRMKKELDFVEKRLVREEQLQKDLELAQQQTTELKKDVEHFKRMYETSPHFIYMPKLVLRGEGNFGYNQKSDLQMVVNSAKYFYESKMKDCQKQLEPLQKQIIAMNAELIEIQKSKVSNPDWQAQLLAQIEDFQQEIEKLNKTLEEKGLPFDEQLAELILAQNAAEEEKALVLGVYPVVAETLGHLARYNPKNSASQNLAIALSEIEEQSFERLAPRVKVLRNVFMKASRDGFVGVINFVSGLF